MKKRVRLILTSTRPDGGPDAAVWRRLKASGEANLRRAGRVRVIVLSLLAQKKDPHPRDVAAALLEGNPDPKLIEYVARVYVLGRARRPGRKSARAWEDERKIAGDYFAEVELAQREHRANSRRPRNVATHAKEIVAKRHAISVRTLEGIIKGLRAEYF